MIMSGVQVVVGAAGMGNLCVITSDDPIQLVMSSKL